VLCANNNYLLRLFDVYSNVFCQMHKEILFEETITFVFLIGVITERDLKERKKEIQQLLCHSELPYCTFSPFFFLLSFLF